MPKIRYRLRDGTLLKTRPTPQSHPWPPEDILAHARATHRFINPDRPSSQPYTVEVTSTAAEKRQARPAVPRPKPPVMCEAH